MNPLAPAWQGWAERRPGPQVLHLDNAAAGRTSIGVRKAVTEFMQRESEVGAYVAQVDVADVLISGRAELAGLLGVRPEGLALLESATTALRSLLRVWPLVDGATVGVLASEWGPNLQLFAERGVRPVTLATEPDGQVDLEELARTLADAPPTLVHLTQVASHRGLVQPIAQAAAVCRSAGVPLWVDAAQALGHVDTSAGVDAVYATGRKWLAGPRGVGLLGIAEPWWERLMLTPPVLAAEQSPIVHWLDSEEANVAGRVGLCVAVGEHLELGPSTVATRLTEVGELTCTALSGTPGWSVVDGCGIGAITALRPTNGQAVADTRARLLADHAILTTACETARAPGEMTEPLLRISPQVDCTEWALDRLRDALAVG